MNVFPTRRNTVGGPQVCTRMSKRQMQKHELDLGLAPGRCPVSIRALSHTIALLLAALRPGAIPEALSPENNSALGGGAA